MIILTSDIHYREPILNSKGCSDNFICCYTYQSEPKILVHNYNALFSVLVIVRTFKVRFEDDGKRLVNGSFTVYDNPTRVEWNVLTVPSADNADKLTVLISIIESWAEAVEIEFEPNGNRMSGGLFNATLNVKFPGGDNLHIDYIRSDDSLHRSAVVNIKGGIPDTFEGLLSLTTIFIVPEFTTDSVTIKGIASRETLPVGVSISLTATYQIKPNNEYSSSDAVQLNINQPTIISSEDQVGVITTSTIQEVTLEGLYIHTHSIAALNECIYFHPYSILQ